MNFIQFIENRHQELTYEVQTNKDAFEVVKDAEIKAAHQLLSFYRIALKWLLVPKVMMNFIQVKLGWKEPPQPVMINKMKAEKLAQEVAEKMKKNTSNVTSLHAPESPKPA